MNKKITGLVLVAIAVCLAMAVMAVEHSAADPWKPHPTRKPTKTKKPHPHASDTPTLTLTPTKTLEPTDTPFPPTSTDTVIPPTATDTAVPPTSTNTPKPPTATDTATPSMSTDTPEPPTATPTGGPSGVAPHFSCLRTDSDPKSSETLPNPAYLEFIIDPQFGTKITRITNGDASSCTHHYSLDQPWNADGTLLFFSKGCKRFLDGNTYEVLFDRSPPGDARWHPTDPNYMIYMSGNVVGLWNPRTGERVVVQTFSGYSSFQFGPGKGNPSNDGRMVSVLAKRNSDGRWVYFGFDLVTKDRYPDIAMDYTGSSAPSSGMHNVTISALGNYHIERYGQDNRMVYDLYGNLVANWTEYGRPSHCDHMTDENGDGVAVGISKSGDPGLIKRRYTDSKVTVIGPKGTHTSARSYLRPGWVYVTHPTNSTFRNEVLAVRIDGGMVERFGYVPNTDSSYLGEGHAVPSPDGRKVIIRANWGSGSLDNYVIEVPCDE